MADLDKDGINDALQEYYDEQKLTDVGAIASPMLSWLRRGKFVGRGVPLPMMTDAGQAISGSFTVANTNRTGAKFKRFMMEDPRRLYMIGSIARDVIDLAAPEAAFGDAKNETQGKLDALARELAFTLFRDENGVCGRIQTITEGSPSAGKTTIVFQDPTDTINLSEGAKLVASATPAGALRAATTYTVESVVFSTGTVVVTGTPATTSLWAVNDYLHREGNAPNGGDAIVPSGFQDWIKGSSVTSTPFRGVDRSVAPERLAGTVLAVGSGSIKEGISELAANLIARGGRPDTCWVNPLRYQRLEMELESNSTTEKIIPRNVSADVAAMIGYTAIRVAAGNGSVLVASDPFCPFSKAFMLTGSTWSFLEIGGKRQPRLVDMGNGVYLRMEDADAVKFQTEAKGDLACTNPGANGILDFS